MDPITFSELLITTRALETRQTELCGDSPCEYGRAESKPVGRPVLCGHPSPVFPGHGSGVAALIRPPPPSHCSLSQHHQPPPLPAAAPSRDSACNFSRTPKQSVSTVSQDFFKSLSPSLQYQISLLLSCSVFIVKGVLSCLGAAAVTSGNCATLLN